MVKDDYFEIYFSNLNKETQKELMKAVGISDPSEMNWDIDIVPIGMYPLPYDSCKIMMTRAID